MQQKLILGNTSGGRTAFQFGRHLSTLALMAALSATAAPSDARQLGRYHHRAADPSRGEDRAEARKPPVGPVYAVISIADQHVSFYDANGLWARSIVSTGVEGHPTPTGVFTILEKERWHRSNIYSGAPMPFMQRLTWTGVAMHEGVTTGHPASHGCVRMPGAFAKFLFGMTHEGQRVIIASQDVTPAAIVNAHLPQPKLSAPVNDAVEGHAGLTSSAVEPVNLTASASATPEPSSAKPLNPLEYAKLIKARAEAKASAAAQAKKSTSAALDAKAQDARLAAKDADAAEEGVRRAQAEANEADRRVQKAQGDAAQRAADFKKSADDKLSAAQERLRQTREASTAKEHELKALQTAVQDADAAAAAATQAAKEAVRRLEPVSLFISRKTGRLYVRQATQHLFDVPVTIRDPERPLGTHLFIATQASDDGATLKWMSLTPPAAAEVKVRPHSSRRGHKFMPEEEVGRAAPFPETAAAALDRIEIPQDALDRVAELVWAGATIVVSDVGMSGEGRFAMDFQILNRTVVREE